MSDLALRGNLDIDLAMDGPDLATDAGLETAVIISLFTDARAAERELPEGHTDRRGWWGDIAAPEDPIGSKLWTLARERHVNAVVVRAEEYARAAVQWLLDDGVVSDVRVSASLRDRDTVILDIDLARRGDAVALRYAYNWREQIRAEA